MAEPEPWCDRAVPGLTARGSSQLSEAQLFDWYDNEFGPAVEEPTARRNQRGGSAGPWRIYEEISVFVVGSGLTVYTYDTIGHNCLHQASDPWDLRNAFSFEGLCVETNLVFWGVGYGKAEPEEPPSDWTVLAFDEGRRIAHGTSDVSVVYAQEFDGEPWHRYDAYTECGID